MNKRMVLQTLVLSGAVALGGIGAAYAGSVDAGKVTYNLNCLGCHGDGANPTQNARVGAASPTNIANAIKSVTQMRIKSLQSLTAADLSNVATYLDKPMTTDGDRIMDWGEFSFPTLLPAPATVASTASGYYFRYYSRTNFYVATQGGHVWAFDGNNPAQGIIDVGLMSTFIPIIEAVPGKNF